MANVQRQYFGVSSGVAQITKNCDDATAIEQGDLVGLTSDLVVPASAGADAGTLAQNQEQFHDIFLGVSRSAHRASHSPLDNVALDIATEGIFRFPVTASSGYVTGDFVGPEGTGTSLAVGVANQLLVKVATANLAIGRIHSVLSATEITVKIESVMAMGGAQAMA